LVKTTVIGTGAEEAETIRSTIPQVGAGTEVGVVGVAGVEEDDAITEVVTTTTEGHNPDLQLDIN
jgi:hypothetical protein